MIYITEISDKEIRGSLGMVVQVMNNLGSLLIYSIGPFVSYTALNSMILSIPICYVILCAWIPESPYYHLKDGRVEAAREEFTRLRETKDQKVTSLFWSLRGAQMVFAPSITRPFSGPLNLEGVCSKIIPIKVAFFIVIC